MKPIITTTGNAWRSFTTDAPPLDGHYLMGVRDSETTSCGRLRCVAAQRIAGVWYLSTRDGAIPMDTSDVVLWADMPGPSVTATPTSDGFSAAELWQAIVRGGLDLSLCRTCSKPVVCLPDGLSNLCEECAETERRHARK